MSCGKVEISVIMPTFNRADKIKKAIESVLLQDFECFELIIINDGSKDDTDEICKEYASKDIRVKFINNKDNNGAAFVRNIGIREAKGNYITFVDDDDIVERELLTFLYDLICEHNADISICGCWFGYDDREEKTIKYVFDDLLILDKIGGLEEFLKREKYNSSNPNKLFKKELFNNIEYKENTYIDDIHLIYKLFAEAQRIVAKGVPLYTYIRHGENNSTPLERNTWTPEILSEYITMQKERVKYLSKKVPEITDRVKYAELSFYISLCNKVITAENEKCYQLVKEMKRILKEREVEFLTSSYITNKEKKLMEKYVCK